MTTCRVGLPRKKNVRERSDEIVQSIADELDMEIVPGSGCSCWANDKLDIRNDDTAIEHKYTDKKSYSLKTSDLLKLCRQSRLKNPLFCITFNLLRNDPGVPDSWVLMPLRTYKQMVDDGNHRHTNEDQSGGD